MSEPQPTKETIQARLEEVELLREVVVKFLDQRVSDLESALKDVAQSSPTHSGVGQTWKERIEKLPWKASEKRPDFSWTFNTTREGAQLPETKEFVDLIRNAGGKLKAADTPYTYSISNDRKFLQRWKAK